jgi:photosystem II stability/assembly factor-like uncharacterized protein
MNDQAGRDLESRLRNHYQTMPVGSSRNLASRVSTEMDRTPVSRWPRLGLPLRHWRTAMAVLAVAALAAVAVNGPTWFAPAAPGGPATTNTPPAAKSVAPSPTASGGAQATSTPFSTTLRTAEQLAGARASQLDRMGTGGAWAVEESSFCTMPNQSHQTCDLPWPASDTDTPTIFVLDEKHAWSVTLTPGSVLGGQGPPFDHLNIVVNRTSDGGITWKQANVPGDYTFSQFGISFVDPMVGYIIASPHEFSSYATVLATRDGGATWAVEATVHMLHGPLGAQLTASDATTLWAGAQPEAKINHPLLAVSRDGGKTWSEVTLPGYQGAWGGDGGETLGPPVFVDSSVGFVTVQASPAPNAPQVPTDTEVFGTKDGGRTWTHETLPAGFPASGSSAPAWYGPDDFIDATNWVAAEGSTLFVTADGKTWKSALGSGLPQGSFAALVFLDPANGFGLFKAADGSGTFLYRTSDGGYEWQPVYGGQP